MQIPPYWIKATYRGHDSDGTDHVFAAYGWSFHSRAAAQEDASARAKRMFDRVILGSDPLYQRLTAKQECFRARLTSKPWRCGCKRPPSLYPWDTPDQEREYRGWQNEYEAKARAYATCEFLQSFGRPIQDEQITLVLASHDQYTCGHAQSRLA